jgi:hypothetical protein
MPDLLMLTTPDGSWAEVTRAAPLIVQHAGPVDLWAVVERTECRWQARGRPGLDAYQVTVGSDGTRTTADD